MQSALVSNDSLHSWLSNLEMWDQELCLACQLLLGQPTQHLVVQVRYYVQTLGAKSNPKEMTQTINQAEESPVLQSKWNVEILLQTNCVCQVLCLLLFFFFLTSEPYLLLALLLNVAAKQWITSGICLALGMLCILLTGLCCNWVKALQICMFQTIWALIMSVTSSRLGRANRLPMYHGKQDVGKVAKVSTIYKLWVYGQEWGHVHMVKNLLLEFCGETYKWEYCTSYIGNQW